MSTVEASEKTNSETIGSRALIDESCDSDGLKSLSGGLTKSFLVGYWPKHNYAIQSQPVLSSSLRQYLSARTDKIQENNRFDRNFYFYLACLLNDHDGFVCDKMGIEIEIDTHSCDCLRSLAELSAQ